MAEIALNCFDLLGLLDSARRSGQLVQRDVRNPDHFTVAYVLSLDLGGSRPEEKGLRTPGDA